MLPKLTSFAISILLLIALPSQAQRWLNQLQDKDTQNLSFYDYQSAFENYYRQNPVDLRLDKIMPTFRFEGVKEETDKVEIEEYKMFKRWEWFTEPRVYPTGRWDFQKMDAEKSSIPRLDDELILKQMELNPLKVKVELGKILFPFPIWRLVGPSDAVGGTNMGRVNCIEFDPSNVKTVYIGSPGGGIWKSTNFGGTWVPKFDPQPTLSTGDIAIDRTNTKIIYVATSDAFGYGVPFWGGTYSVGVMKSIDGGNTWTMTGLSWTVGQNRTIRRLVISPTNSKVLLAATSNGLYRTDDAGSTWKQIWTTSTFDVEFQPDNGKVVYTTTSRVSKSTDEGITFTALTTNCAGSRYNIEVSKSNPKVLYTLCTTGVVQKSTDAGATWTTVTAPGVSLYGYYDNVIAVSPASDKIVYVAGFNIKKTTDGGVTWSAVPTAGHVDNHCLEFLPMISPVSGANTIFCGNDGGLFKTANGGTTWSSLNKGLAITQFYRLGISKTLPAITLCGAQDNGNMKSNAAVFTNITNADGMENFVDWSNANTFYCGTQNGSLNRSLTGGATFTNINTPSSGAWITPWCQDPKISKTIYAGTDKVYKSLNQGTVWRPISPVLTGIGSFTTLKVANSDPRWIYAGNSKKLYRTIIGGGTTPTSWTDITAGLPVAGNYITYVTCSDKNPKIAYVTFSGYNAGEKVYKTTDAGLTWSNISGTIPNMPVNCIVYENNIKNALYIGTDAGVYYRNDDLKDWIPYKFGLPNVIVDELEIHYGKKVIRAATYGRGLWQAPLKSL